MREKTFEAPSAKKILDLNDLTFPKSLSNDYILAMIADGKFVLAGNSFKEAVEKCEQIRDRRNAITLFSPGFAIDRDEFNRMSKSLDSLVKIDSQQALRKASKSDNVPKTLTKEFLEENKIRPENLIGAAMSFADVENPPIGFYWVGWDRIPRTAMWLQSASSAEILVLDQRKDFAAGRVKDNIPYGRNMRVEVSSRSAEGKSYEFSLFRMPIFTSNRDPRRYSYWVNMSHNSSDPFSSYMSEHDQQTLPQCFWSTSAITGVYLSMTHLSNTKNPLQFKINPFPIPADEKSVGFIDDLRLRSLLLFREESGKFGLRPLNKSEMNRLIGARTALRGYDSCWFNMGKRSLDYLCPLKS